MASATTRFGIKLAKSACLMTVLSSGHSFICCVAVSTYLTRHDLQKVCPQRAITGATNRPECRGHSRLAEGSVTNTVTSSSSKDGPSAFSEEWLWTESSKELIRAISKSVERVSQWDMSCGVVVCFIFFFFFFFLRSVPPGTPSNSTTLVIHSQQRKWKEMSMVDWPPLTLTDHVWLWPLCRHSFGDGCWRQRCTGQAIATERATHCKVLRPGECESDHTQH